MTEIKYGAAGAMTDAQMNGAVAQMFEQQGYDFIIWADQQSLTIPRSVWTPDMAPGAAVFDIDTNFDGWLLAADAAARTERMEIGVTVCDGIRRAPSLYAQMVLTMDHLTKGRYFHCMGSGEMRHFSPYGIEREKPFAHLEESVKIQRMLMEADGPISYDGPIWSLKNAVMTAMPYGDSPPPILIAGGGPRALRIAGQLGDGWVTMLPAGGDPEVYAKQAQTVRDHAEKAGRDPDALRMYALILGVITETEEEAQAATEHPLLRWDSIALIPDPEVFKNWGIMEHPIRPDYSYSRDIISMDWGREETLAVIEKVPPSIVRKARATGTPKQVAAELQGYADAGCNYFNIINYAGFLGSGSFADAAASQGLVTETIRLMRERNGQTIPAGMAEATTQS